MGAAFRLYEESTTEFGIPHLRVISTLTTGCYNATELAADDEERALWMARSLRLFADGQTFNEQLQLLTDGLTDESTAARDTDDAADAADAAGSDGGTDLHRMSLPALRQFVTERLGAGVISLAVGRGGRTKADIVREAKAALSAQQPLPGASLVANSPLLAASRLDVAARRLEKAQQMTEMHELERSKQQQKQQRGGDGGRRNEWMFSEDGRMYPANRRTPFWARSGEMAEDGDEPLEMDKPRPNTKAAWHATRKEAKRRQWERDKRR